MRLRNNEKVIYKDPAEYNKWRHRMIGNSFFVCGIETDYWGEYSEVVMSCEKDGNGGIFHASYDEIQVVK